MNREPLITVASLTAVATALLGMLVAFGVSLSDAQTAAVLGVVAVVAPLVVAVVGRQRVTPVPRPRHRHQRRSEGGQFSVERALVIAIFVVLLLVVLGWAFDRL